MKGHKMTKKLTAKQKLALKKYLTNLLKFTAPTVAVFFGQLATGVELKIAAPVALLALWGALADYFKKLK